MTKVSGILFTDEFNDISVIALVNGDLCYSRDKLWPSEFYAWSVSNLDTAAAFAQKFRK